MSNLEREMEAGVGGWKPTPALQKHELMMGIVSGVMAVHCGGMHWR